MRDRSRGSVTIEVLMTMMIVSMLIPIVMSCLSVMKGGLVFTQEVQDEIALQQLRRILLIAQDFQVEENTVYFLCGGEEQRISLVNGNLILQPGTQIFLTELDDLCFTEQNSVIYVTYARNDVFLKAALAHE